MLCLSPNKQSLSFILLLLQPWLLNFRRKETPRSGVQPVESSCSRSAKYVCLATIYLLRNCFHVFLCNKVFVMYLTALEMNNLESKILKSSSYVQEYDIKKRLLNMELSSCLQKPNNCSAEWILQPHSGTNSERLLLQEHACY